MIFRSIEDIDSWGIVEEASDHEGDITLMLARKGEKPAYGQITINVHESDDNSLMFEVYGELEEIEFEESLFEHIDVESIMKEFANLKPVVTEGLTHYYGIEELGGKTDLNERKAERNLKVRFRIFSNSYEQNEDATYDFDLDQMAEGTLQYVTALHKISKALKR